ncbi:MAG: lyase family protein, partial [Planctomycetota bacterium]|nr:lyase family protein [Planctomycetota bacterium]
MHDNRDQHTWQGYLLCEAALAAAEADCGLIPREAAEAIIAQADCAHIDLALVAQESGRTRHAMMPIIRALSAACGEQAGGYVHWGATTQNIRQSAEMLELRGFHRWLCHSFAQVLTRLSELADAHRATLCAGRSHGLHAIPTTFGHLVASWLSAGTQWADHLHASGAEALRAQLGGAVGTLASFGEHGMAVMNGFRGELLDKVLGYNGHATAYSAIGEPISDFDRDVEALLEIPGVVRAMPFVEAQVMASSVRANSGALVRG